MTTSYHPQANGMVERVHRQLKDALRARELDLIGLNTFCGSCWGYVPPPRRPQVYLYPSWFLVSLWFYLES